MTAKHSLLLSACTCPFPNPFIGKGLYFCSNSPSFCHQKHCFDNISNPIQDKLHNSCDNYPIAVKYQTPWTSECQAPALAIVHAMRFQSWKLEQRIRNVGFVHIQLRPPHYPRNNPCLALVSNDNWNSLMGVICCMSKVDWMVEEIFVWWCWWWWKRWEYGVDVEVEVAQKEASTIGNSTPHQPQILHIISLSSFFLTSRLGRLVMLRSYNMRSMI